MDLRGRAECRSRDGIGKSIPDCAVGIGSVSSSLELRGGEGPVSSMSECGGGVKLRGRPALDPCDLVSNGGGLERSVKG